MYRQYPRLRHLVYKPKSPHPVPSGRSSYFSKLQLEHFHWISYELQRKDALQR